jgi:nitrogen-specific signal transduction histidine kinase
MRPSESGIEAGGDEGGEAGTAVEWNILHELFHETKNPLQIITSAVALLETEPPPKRKKILYAAIRENAQKINDILNGGRSGPSDRSLQHGIAQGLHFSREGTLRLPPRPLGLE